VEPSDGAVGKPGRALTPRRHSTQEQILADYPQLTPDGLAAAFRYAADAQKGEQTSSLVRAHQVSTFEPRGTNS
jgi:hypothetical protein